MVRPAHHGRAAFDNRRTRTRRGVARSNRENPAIMSDNNPELLKEGQGSRIAVWTPEETEQSGDQEFLNRPVPLGVVGLRPAQIVDRIVDYREEQSQISFKVFAIGE